MIKIRTIAKMMSHAWMGGEQRRRTYEANGACRAYGTHGANRAHGASSHFSLFILSLFLLFTFPAAAQEYPTIKVGGNVYGGGNQADVNGNATVTVYKGDVVNVFGGARMANVGGRTFVNIDGKNASGDIMITSVYGGNDISGTIGQSGEETTVPTELENVLELPIPDGKTKAEYRRENPTKNYVDNTWKTFVATSRSTKPEDANVENWPIIIGSLYGGGNGDYDYENIGGEYRIYRKNHGYGDAPIATNTTGFNVPEVEKTYLELKGGCIAHAYGGGNNATVTKNTTINIDNHSSDLQTIAVQYHETTGLPIESIIASLKSKAQLSQFQSNLTTYDYNFARVYGGNNRAAMSIRPTWNLQAGKIRDLYSGGNRGNMTCSEGLLLDINPEVSEDLSINNVYGGCRMADVRPSDSEGEYIPVMNLTQANYPDADLLRDYYFPDQLSARTLVQGGTITNVYGGNDITGDVYGGNAVYIYSTIYGDVYGGGNGAYAYTDNSEGLENNKIYNDFYYSIPSGMTSYEALNAHRPNAEQVSIFLAGNGPADYTKILGSVYVGGNCASLANKKPNPLVELKIGSYVIADNVFLGNNGAKMVDPTILELYAKQVDDAGNMVESDGTQYSFLNLKDESVFSQYMEGVCMNLQPSLVFASEAEGDPATYLPNSSYVGSFYCGGNVGSMGIEGKNTYRIDNKLNIFTKFVGGCNNAYIPEGEYNAAYDGGVLGAGGERDDYWAGDKMKDRLEINLQNLTITPLRWDDTKTRLIWNTNKMGVVYGEIKKDSVLQVGSTYYTYNSSTKEYEEQTVTGSPITADGETQFEKGEDFVEVDNIPFNDPGYDPEDYEDVRLLDGNVYGGCYDSGHVNGNVIININEDVLARDEVFGTGTGPYGRKASGVELEEQRDDLNAVALSVFGAGYGEQTEIWGSTTVNLNNGYVFQIFGGGELGVVGKKNAEGDYVFNPAYSSTVNLNGASPIYSSTDSAEDLAETEYIYGGGNEGDVCGNTYVNLGNGRIYDAFGGASDADILGHTEVYIGRQPNGSGGYQDGFPWIRDIVYGGNDFGGTIQGAYEDGYNFTARVRDYDATKATQLHGNPTSSKPGLLRSASYVEYLQGRVDTIYGGSYGYYDYVTEYKGYSMPYLSNTFVNIRPKVHDKSAITSIFGGGTGYPKNREGDKSQDQSYVLIDIPEGIEKFATTSVFGSGSYNGLGMRFNATETMQDSFNPDRISAIIDLYSGKIQAAYGGSYNEGLTARTVVNVPSQSTINIQDIFGGAYGTQILPPCDVYESNINFNNTSENARVTGSIYGGNNDERRTLYTHVNISSPVWSNKEKGYLAKVYGAGRGIDTWSEYTDVNLEKGAKVYEVYGGGEMGHVLNSESVQKYMQLYKRGPSDQISTDDPYWKDSNKWDIVDGFRIAKPAYAARWAADWKDAWTFGSYYVPTAKDGSGNLTYTDYVENPYTNLSNEPLVTTQAEMDDRDFSGYSTTEKEKRQYRYNTNVRIKEGATVVNYAYGGGYGTAEKHLSGDVYGTTYIALLGGTVIKDIYAAGTAGAVNDLFGMGPYNASTNPTGFTASANAYIKGGSCRNVYGGGWLGNVGHHTGEISASVDGDIDGETHVVIGNLAGTSFTNGIPTIQRNAYGGGEGGAVYGTAHLTLNNGYIGYDYDDKRKDDDTTENIDERYKEKTEDDTKDTPNTLLADAGCLFGGGYIDNSYVDKTYVNIYGGHVRNSAFGGGEVAAIGRGDMKLKAGTTDYELNGIYRPGKTNIEMFGGHVHRNVYGGGRGYDNLGKHGSLHSPGYIFGQTEVHVHGGEIGTVSGVADGDGNVFGGGDIGVVYSAYENKPADVETYGRFGWGVKSGARYDGLYQGYYYKHKFDDHDDTAEKFLTENEGERILTEDCKVVIEPNLKVITPVTINSHAYEPGAFVPIDDLNTMKNKNEDSRWGYLDDSGIIIHNAVFAGGNTSPGSTTTSANTTSVYGNATASINDIYHRDMITLGTRNTGGLYGDGNLTLVDGYRELNITNYGTDYYSIDNEIDITTYHSIPEREAAYYELNYTCTKTCQDRKKNTYTPGSGDSKPATITADAMMDLFLVYNEDKYESFVYEGKAVLIWNASKEVWEPNPDAGYWEESGVLPVYAGRLMNSIQRADFCGVFGSRMVMKGARDRVTDVADYTNYTINRVREVSLNKVDSKIESDLAISESDNDYYRRHTHGNYFGIYNVVNYLGALTSDVDFGDETTNVETEIGKTAIRKTENDNVAEYQTPTANGHTYGKATYYDWKKQFIHERKRNNGFSHNKLALASGVYLEITTEESTGTDLYEKVWGPITGVVELDLINVAAGIGGGFVYAKNVHGIRKASGRKNTTLTALNDEAVTRWDYIYNPPETIGTDPVNSEDQKTEWQSSGNFVHSTLTIIDDCYNISNRYKGETAVPAHYWYVKGSTYVYDQYISAYTGSPNAYSETVNIPLTLTAASYGRMKLLNVMPNLYAYYSRPGEPLGSENKLTINEKDYYKNDPISYWDWYLLSDYEKELFVEKTYVNSFTCKIDGKEYETGTYVMNEADLAKYKTSSHTYTDSDNQPIKDANDQAVGDDYVFRLSNNASHNKGYILTYEVDNPGIWDNWYTKVMDEKVDDKYVRVKNQTGGSGYEDGPTYHLKGDADGQLLGQNDYKKGDIIAETVKTTYETIPAEKLPTGQATFEQAYVLTKNVTVTKDDTEYHLYKGTTITNSDFGDGNGNWPSELSGKVDEAYLCTRTIQVTKEDIIYKDSKISEKEKDDYIADVKRKMNDVVASSSEKTIDEIKALPTSGEGAVTVEQRKALLELAAIRNDLTTHLVAAYACQTEGKYGGNYYVKNRNYRGLEAWSSLSEEDRKQFTFNYDALDLLIDSLYSRNLEGVVIHEEGEKYQYDDPAGTLAKAEENPAGYSLLKPVDYTATYKGEEGDDPGSFISVSTDIVSSGKVYIGDELDRTVFEKLPNEQRYFSPIAVKAGVKTYYVVHTPFQVGSTPYAVGETISEDIYKGLTSAGKACVTELIFTTTPTADAAYYYCREEFTRATSISTVESSIVTNAGSGYDETAKKVAKGSLIEKTTYDGLPNQQKNFTIHGISPTETSTLYVSRESNIYDLTQEKIITVIYEYNYDETNGNGNITPISERHVLNIHLNFKSGIPIVEDIDQPDIILPGDFVGLREPNVTPGAYEVTGGGWTLFESKTDAESHSNGIDYNPDTNPLYWFQDGYYAAYYAKSYLGRTYSNHVPVAVANYHDLADVMSDDNKTHHMYIDHKGVKRDSKIYINNYSSSDKNGLDLFKNLYDLSLETRTYDLEGNPVPIASGTLKDHVPMDSRVKGGANLEFFLRTDIDHSEPWTPIGDATQCFDGVLHGDGHTISGLDNSLFGDLCGEVYNLGVTGSFNTAGVADTDTKKEGYVESCWVKTTGTTPLGTKPYPVFGAPAASDGYQLVNSYYSQDNASLYNTGGKATQMVDDAFYNGEVAYDLNNFYLYKRYNDHTTPGASPAEYKYWKAGEAEPLTGKYASKPDLCSSGYTYHDATLGKDVTLKYVEDRFADGDFRYAAGVIPEEEDERHWQETVSGSGETAVKEDRWSPIFPDDYIFFGQKLTYGWAPQAHQTVPTAVVREDGRLAESDNANRVYRAPAYYRSKKMDVAHFNPMAYLAQKSKDGSRDAHPNMTAIDFAGHNDIDKAYQLGWKNIEPGVDWFYQPLLDDDGLTGISNCDETQNLLVYAPAETAESGYANKKTFDVLNAYFTEPAYTTYYDNNDGYSLVRENEEAVNGHLVLSDLTATNDHLLIDKQDFNAPLAYTFDGSHRMWYQRKPLDAEYVDRTKGWQGISLPFTADLVTTNRKGEITHFYSGSETSKNSDKKIGHEYWLRELENGSVLTQAKDANGEDIENTYTATFNYPAAGGTNKTVTNTFLWDYYYLNEYGHNQLDQNADTYLQYQQYYRNTRTYENYPRLTAAKPYILGLPGATYYEFDLSGKFAPTTTALPNPSGVGKQVITFASNTGEHIGVSDNEPTTPTTATYTSTTYTFKPNYMNWTLENGDYVLNSYGDAFVKLDDTPTSWNTTGSTYTFANEAAYNTEVAAGALYTDEASTKPLTWEVYNASDKSRAATYYKRTSVKTTKNDKHDVSTTLYAFRPYFTASVSGGVKGRLASSIVFTSTNGEEFEQGPESALDGDIEIFARGRNIITRSHMKEPVTIRIVNIGGINVATFILPAGQTIETPVQAHGAYIVNKKKVFVR